jgi:hypothetical protein
MPSSDLTFDFSPMSLSEKEKDDGVAEANAEKQELFIFGSNTKPAVSSSPETISQSPPPRQTDNLSSNPSSRETIKTEPDSKFMQEDWSLHQPRHQATSLWV